MHRRRLPASVQASTACSAINILHCHRIAAPPLAAAASISTARLERERLGFGFVCGDVASQDIFCEKREGACIRQLPKPCGLPIRRKFEKWRGQHKYILIPLLMSFKFKNDRPFKFEKPLDMRNRYIVIYIQTPL